MATSRGRGLALVAVLLAFLPALVAVGPAAEAATPNSGTISPAQPQLQWTGPVKTAYTAGTLSSDPANPGTVDESSDASCTQTGAYCDDVNLTVSLPTPDYWTTHHGGALIALSWASQSSEFDLFVYKLDALGNRTLVGSSVTTPSVSAEVRVENASGDYLVRVAYSPVANSGYTGVATFETGPLTPPNGTGVAPRYQTFAAPVGMGDGGSNHQSEPSIGANWKTGAVMFQSTLQTLRVNFDDCSSPPRATWTDVTDLSEGAVTSDAILHSDSATGRCFVSQLVGKTSLMAYTDDDGQTWTQSQGAGINSGSTTRLSAAASTPAAPVRRPRRRSQTRCTTARKMRPTRAARAATRAA